MNKGGCILLSKDYKKVCLIKRPKLHDYSFPKGHMEQGEQIIDCAVRETEEETLRKIKLLSNEPVSINIYNNYEGEIKCYFYLAVDDGPLEREIKEEDKEICEWIDYNEVDNLLTYQDLKDTWNEAQDKIKTLTNIS